MTSKKRLLRNIRLCLILDKDACSKSGLRKTLRQALKAGVLFIQYRDKHSTTKDAILKAKPLLDIARKNKAIFIINDRIDVALAINADGLHAGQEDIPLPLARKILGPEKILGLSCHSPEQAQKAPKEADYLGFGPIFKTATKPHLTPIGINQLRRAVWLTRKPIFAIGDINTSNASSVLSIGPLQGIAVCRAICQSQNISKSVNNLLLNK